MSEKLADPTGRRDEIEITAEMIAAGAEALAGWVYDDADVVAEIAYLAMERVRRLATLDANRKRERS